MKVSVGMKDTPSYKEEKKRTIEVLREKLKFKIFRDTCCEYVQQIS